MPQLNANTPYIQCFVRNAFLYSDWANKELTECYIFGVKAVLNKPLMFHCQLENGVVWFSLPIHAFVHKEDFESSFVKYILRANIAGLTIINIIKLLIAKFITLFEVV